jgi:hypothetical protein
MHTPLDYRDATDHIAHLHSEAALHRLVRHPGGGLLRRRRGQTRPDRRT